MKKYGFLVPVKLKYIADESNLSIESIEDLEEIQDTYDVNLQDIIDEYEYKSDMGTESFDEDDDYYGMSDDGLFDEIIDDKWDEIVDILNKEVKLSDIDTDKVELIFNYIKNDFNTSNSIKKSVIDFNNKHNFNIQIIDMINYNKQKSEITINISVDNELNDIDISNLKNLLEYQINDSWGDDISNFDLSDIINEENYYVYLIPWSLKNDIKIIK